MRYLKIKDNIDLKELEKFGFEYYRMVYVKEAVREEGDLINKVKIYVSETNREISIGISLFNVDVELVTIYDLIKADMVEVIENDK